jgi:FkbM family methyltransferase
MLQPLERLKEYFVCARDLGDNPKDACNIFWRETKNLRVRLKLGSYHPREVYSLSTVYGPLHFRDNFGDITNLPGLFHQNVYRSTTLTGAGVILDVGANIGLAAAWFSLHNPNRPIYCFEPLKANVALVRKNCPRAIVKQAAVGAVRGSIKLQVDPDSVMASSIPCRWKTTQAEFDVITLDEFISEQRIERVALLKVDVEGMEIEILKGAGETLKRTARVAMETHAESRHCEALRRLKEAGFTIDAEEFSNTTGLVFASSKIA